MAARKIFLIILPILLVACYKRVTENGDTVYVKCSGVATVTDLSTNTEAAVSGAAVQFIIRDDYSGDPPQVFAETQTDSNGRYSLVYTFEADDYPSVYIICVSDYGDDSVCVA